MPRAITLSVVVLLLLGGASVAVWKVLSVVEAAEAATPVLFDQGSTALNPRAPKGWTNHWCGRCHQREYEEWTKSRHFVAGVNENFRAQVLESEGGRVQWCVNCHVPINPGVDLLPTQQPENLEAVFESPPEWLSNGVDCISCHVRDGKVLVTRISEKSQNAHPVRLAPELATAEFCAGCHQFNFKDDDLPDSSTGHLQQASFEEFLDYRATGGGALRCHDCHMEDGNHVMPGGYSLEMLRRALELEVSMVTSQDSRSLQITVAVTAQNVGHRVPGGEHFFRLLTLHTNLIDDQGFPIQRESEEAASQHEKVPPREGGADHPDDLSSAGWPKVEIMDHKIGLYETYHVPGARPYPNTRLFPDEVRRFNYFVALDLDRGERPVRIRAELWYHLLHDEKAIKFGFSPDDMKWRVHRVEKALIGNVDQ